MNRHSIVMTIAVAAMTLATACHDPDKYSAQSPLNPGGTDADTVLAVSAKPDRIPGDGISRTTITATIDPRSTVRQIFFQTDFGKLFGAGKETAAGTAVAINADERGIATVELQSDSKVVTAQVSVSVTPAHSGTGPPPPAVVRILDVPFEAVDLGALLTLESSVPSLPADGFSEATITATIKGNGDRRQNVVFGTSRGSLVKFNAVDGDTAPTTVKADASGIARIRLISDSTVGTSRVTARVIDFERELLLPFTPINPTDVVQVNADAAQAPADGATLTRIVATVAAAIPQAGRQVTFTTTDGEFTGNRDPKEPNNTQRAVVTADASNQAVVFLKSPQIPANASVSASVGNVTGRTSIVFSRALPDTIFVTVTAPSVNRSGSDHVTIHVELLRDVGQVASNTAVTYEARDASGAVIGAFSGITLAVGDSGDPFPKPMKSSADFNPDDTAATGTTTVTARVGTVSGTITIQIN